MACRSKGGGELSSEGPVGKGEERNKPCARLEQKHQRAEIAPQLLFRPVVRLQLALAFPGSFPIHRGTKFS